MPFGIKDYHKGIKTLHVGCMPQHAYFIPYESKDRLGLPREESAFFKPLTGAWDFKLYASIHDVPNLHTVRPDFEDKIEVPSSWQYTLERGYDVPHYSNHVYPFPMDPPHVPEENPTGVYSREFTVDRRDYEGKDAILTFEGVDSCFYLFINSAFVGYSQVSHSTSEFNITRHLRDGENNITVAVLKWCDGTYLEDQDMYRVSGIFREVYILARDRERIDDIFVKTDIAEDLSSAKIRAELRTSGEVAVRYALKDAGGCEISSGECSISGDGVIEVADVTSPHLWSDESPYLYELILSSGEEHIRIPVGVRKIEIKGDVILINGKKVKAKGVNRHDSHPLLGHATPYDHILRDVMIVKAHNCNMIRTSHYPSDPRFYEICDRLGVYVCDETDLECHGFGVYTEPMPLTDDAEWEHVYLDRAERMLERDKNFTCVIMWSVGNESGAGRNHKAMADYFRERDGSRILHLEDESRRACHASDRLERGELTQNAAEYWRSYTDIESRMYPSIAEIKKRYIDKSVGLPVFLCEYCHAMGNGPGDLSEYMKVFYEYDHMFGGCIWELLDHSVAGGDNRYTAPRYYYGGDLGDMEPSFASFCVDGLLYPDRRVHTGMLEAREAYKPYLAEYKDGTLKITSRRHFTSLSDLSMLCTVERCGKVVRSLSVSSLDIAPGKSKKFKIDLTGLDEISTLTVKVAHATEKPYAPVGTHVGIDQFILEDAIAHTEPRRSAVHVAESDSAYEISYGETVVRIGKLSGLIESIADNGGELLVAPVTPIAWRAPTDNDRIIKLDWRENGLDRLKCLCSGTSVKQDGKNTVVRAKLTLAATGKYPAMSILAKYIFDGSHVKADLHVKVSDTVTAFLPRFGLRFSLPEQFEDYTYFGYGPYESYEDKRLASHLSVFRDSATDSFEHYVRPQENGSHYGCRWAVAHSPSGRSLMLGAESFSLSVSHFEPHYLTGFAHDFELVPERHTTIIADYRNSGIGSGSCGPQLLEKYQLKEKEFNFSLAIKPTRISDEFAFAQYKELI